MNDIDQDVKSLFILHNLDFMFCDTNIEIVVHFNNVRSKSNDRITVYNNLINDQEIDIFVNRPPNYIMQKSFKYKEHDNILNTVIRCIHEFIQGECKYCIVDTESIFS